MRSLILRRLHALTLDARPSSVPADPGLLDVLEGDLAAIGYLLSTDARDALSRLAHADLLGEGAWLYEQLLVARGADVHHVPQFRGFPETTPRDTRALFVQRVVNYLLAHPDLPCPWGTDHERAVVVSPCGHVVCPTCFDGADHSGCPICHRRLDADHPFLADMPTSPADQRQAPVVARLVPIRYEADPDEAAARVLRQLLGRPVALSPADLGDVRALVAHFGPNVTRVLPERIAARETMATVVGDLAREHEACVDLIGVHVGSTADVLRIASVLMGGDAALLSLPPRGRRSLPRRLRRALLDALDARPARDIVDEFSRRGEYAKRILRTLHPLERATAHPRAAWASCWLMGQSIDALPPVVRERALDDGVHVADDGRIQASSWRGRIEVAFSTGEAQDAIALLAQRPGELLRALNRLLVLAGDDRTLLDALAEALDGAVPKAASPLLLSVAAELRARTRPRTRRVFTPKGSLVKAYGMPDTRDPLPVGVVGPIVDVLEAELLARQTDGPNTILLDEAMRGVPAPISARAGSDALDVLPRGSSLPVDCEAGAPLRLFLHWQEKDHQRIDLDLSVAFYAEDGRYMGLCDYTNLRAGRYATHSGDLTSAPAPLGATEYVDLYLNRLRRAGVATVAMIVFSYNGVPFDAMDEAFAGFMVAPSHRTSQFHAGAVRQRFDLHGPARIAVPLVLDVGGEAAGAPRLRWTDLNGSEHGRYHSVYAYRTALRRLVVDLPALFDHRASVFDVVALIGAASARVVHVRGADGTVIRIDRDRSSSEHFLERILELDGRPDALPDEVDLFALAAPAATTGTGWIAGGGGDLLADDLLARLTGPHAR